MLDRTILKVLMYNWLFSYYFVILSIPLLPPGRLIPIILLKLDKIWDTITKISHFAFCLGSFLFLFGTISQQWVCFAFAISCIYFGCVPIPPFLVFDHSRVSLFHSIRSKEKRENVVDVWPENFGIFNKYCKFEG